MINISFKVRYSFIPFTVLEEVKKNQETLAYLHILGVTVKNHYSSFYLIVCVPKAVANSSELFIDSLFIFDKENCA